MIELSNANTEEFVLDILEKKKVKAAMLRLDKIHPVLSGNKWFKLKYHLQEAAKAGKTTLLTFGGAYSNHIIATACAARENGFVAIGVIRGEMPSILSPTLQMAASYGMQLFFISREAFKNKAYPEVVQNMLNVQNDIYIIPEGGAGTPGIKGSEEIMALAIGHPYSHIMCAIGTGTMYTGILNASSLGQQVIGIPVLKGMDNLQTIYRLQADENKKDNIHILPDYHMGGYAKKTPELLQLMNDFYDQTGIPTDFVYTGKLIYALLHLTNNNYFPVGSRILVIHSGGLQGNNSLAPGTMHF